MGRAWYLHHRGTAGVGEQQRGEDSEVHPRACEVFDNVRWTRPLLSLPGVSRHVAGRHVPVDCDWVLHVSSRGGVYRDAIWLPEGCEGGPQRRLHPRHRLAVTSAPWAQPPQMYKRYVFPSFQVTACVGRQDYSCLNCAVPRQRCRGIAWTLCVQVNQSTCQTGSFFPPQILSRSLVVSSSRYPVESALQLIYKAHASVNTR